MARLLLLLVGSALVCAGCLSSPLDESPGRATLAETDPSRGPSTAPAGNDTPTPVEAPPPPPSGTTREESEEYSGSSGLVVRVLGTTCHCGHSMRAFDIRVPPAYLTATMAVEWHVVGQVGTTNGAGMELTLSENGTHLFREDAGAGERTWTFASNDPRLRDGASLLLEPREGGIARELEYTVRLTFVVRDAPEGPGS